MTTVVTGGAGFIGSALARRLAEGRRAGDRIVLADDLSHGSPRSPVQPLVTGGSVELIRGDLCSTATFANLPDAVDRVYHLAGIVGVGRVTAHPFDTLERNLRMTLNTIQWFRRAAQPEAR